LPERGSLLKRRRGDGVGRALPVVSSDADADPAATLRLPGPASGLSSNELQLMAALSRQAASEAGLTGAAVDAMAQREQDTANLRSLLSMESRDVGEVLQNFLGNASDEAARIGDVDIDRVRAALLNDEALGWELQNLWTVSDTSVVRGEYGSVQRARMVDRFRALLFARQTSLGGGRASVSRR